MVIYMGEQIELCSICNRLCSEGVQFVKGFICQECLENISVIQVGDPEYAFYVAKLKELWQAG